MKFAFLALFLLTGSAIAAERTYSCLPNNLYKNTDIGTILIKGDISKTDVKSISELRIKDVKQVIKAGSTESVYFYAMKDKTRKLAFELSFESINGELSFEKEMRLYVYGKSSWSEHADPVPAFQIAVYLCKRK